MKRLIGMLAAVLTLSAALCGCQGEPAAEERPWAEEVTYSHLSDPETRKLAESLLTALPVSEADRRVFFDHVDQINGCLEPGERTEGFETLPITQPKYDPYEVQARWDADHLDFPGYNCRITAFSLIRPLLRVENPDQTGSQDDLMLDLLSLEEDPSALPTEAEQAQFRAFYSGIGTENTKDINVHLEHIQQAWAERGVSFEEGGATLISMFFHNQLDGDRLSIGHTGILTEQDGQLYFLEKLAFQEPYQLVRVQDRAELSDYLMTKYDVEFNQPTAHPIILENDHLLEGYRPRPEA